MTAPHTPPAERLATQGQRLLAELGPRRTAPTDSEISRFLQFAQSALREDMADEALPVLERLVELCPTVTAVHYLLGCALRDQQRMPEAVAAYQRAFESDAHHLPSRLGHAQVLHAMAEPSADLFSELRVEHPQDTSVLRGLATALATEHRMNEADDLLDAALRTRPDWIEGHRILTSLRWTCGEKTDYARSYQAACQTQPQNRAVWLSWFSAVAQSRDWDRARQILAAAQRALGPSMPLLLAELFVATESGDLARAEPLFSQTEGVGDPVRDLALIRHALRSGDVARCEPVAVGMLGTSSATLAWPYVSLIWRLTNDPRARWLEGDGAFVRAMDLPIGEAELTELADYLRALHTAQAPYLELSVRGGTQTDGQLFFRTDPRVLRLKQTIEDAIRQYIAALPAMEQGHPLLGLPRTGRVRYSGSWSVRLTAKGHHVSHTHPAGWISAALYIALPNAVDRGPPPGGWISFGCPPSELGLRLPAHGSVEPKTGRLVLFPSTLWHNTHPFDAGERLVVAFDVKPLRGTSPQNAGGVNAAR
jgi:cytochrome c-type biogenesis protein CcmH/NrfG